MPVNWPPPTAPVWPPPELSTTWLSFSDIRVLVAYMQDLGFTQSAPTAAERNLYFKDARCDHGDTVLGKMLISPGGVRYPFAVCTDAGHRDLLVLWPPHYAGFDSGREA